MSQNEDRLTVLVAIDYSATSGRAMAWAVDYAQRAPCDLHLVHVLDRTLHVGDLSPNARDMQAEIDGITVAARKELEAMTRSDEALVALGPIKRHVSIGRPAHEIVDLAVRLHADLIVMGTHGRTGIRRAVIGSVAEHVVRHAPCTVVCVKPTVIEEPAAG